MIVRDETKKTEEDGFELSIRPETFDQVIGRKNEVDNLKIMIGAAQKRGEVLDHIVFYGSKGAIYIKGHYGSGPLYLYDADKEWREQALPGDIAANIPNVAGDTERNWRYLIRQFVKDINGEDVPPYQTFKEGAQYQSLIDTIRKNDDWVDVTHLQSADES